MVVLSSKYVGIVCDNKKDGEDESPYHRFTCFGNPEPMITLLEEALAVQKVRENDRT